MRITRDFQIVNLEGYIFEDEQGQAVAYTNEAFGFVIDNKFVSRYCKSAGGSSLPMAYDRRVAREIQQSGFIVEELAYCEPVEIY